MNLSGSRKVTRKLTRKLMCYDARVGEGDAAWDWSESRRRNYLYRLDVKTPLSVDRVGWPAILDADKRPGYTGPFDPSWQNLQSLKQYLKAIQSTGNSYQLIAISIDVSWLTAAETDYLNTHLGNTRQPRKPITEIISNLANPNEVGNHWMLLGYDVADLAFTSGLCNMGFVPRIDDVAQLRATWGPLLNRYHLFDDINNANSFKEFSNIRVAEHAPFFVYGLWRVEQFPS